MARLLRTGELALVAVLAVLVVASATGWLYIVEPSTRIGRPLVRDALALDELPHHSAVPLVVYLAVWLAAGGLLGLLASIARIERLTAALLFALWTFAWLFATTSVSILVVRQVPAAQAFRDTAHVPAIYLGAALAGLGGALLGKRHAKASRRAPVVLAAFVAASGILDVASAITPAIDSRLHLIESATPDVVPKLASALVVPAGLALVVLARGLWRRRYRAWLLTVVFVFGAAAFHILKGLNYEEATANVLIGLALVARRHDFAGRGDPRTRTRVMALLPLYVGGIFAYGAVALWVNRLAADRPWTFSFAFHETAESLVGLHLRGSEHLSGPFGEWFPVSVLVLGVAAGLSLLFTWLAPWRYRFSAAARERDRAHGLVEAFGTDTLSPFALRGDKSYFFDAADRAFLAYRVIAGVAVVSGDPVGDEAALDALLERFIAFARERDWRIAVLGVCEEHLDLYHRHGLHALYHGDEAVVGTASFSLEGRAIRKVRQSVSRLEKAGYSCESRYAAEIAEGMRAELEQVAIAWRGDEPERGFTMELDELFRLDGEDAVFVVGRDPEGAIAGFLHFAVSRAGSALSLSSMPRLRTTPNGFNEWLIVNAIAWAAEHGLERVSLNFAPFAALFNADTGLTRWQRLQRRALESMKFHFQLDSLLAFNDKFFPRWVHRYVVYESVGDLPRVGLAGLAAEGYVPFPKRAR
jgi:lysyl-tRNA synthetase, class II